MKKINKPNQLEPNIRNEKKMTLKKIILITTLTVLSSCAHHKDVRPGADGIHRVVVKADGDEGQRNALDQAKDYCDQFNKSIGIIEEKQTYTGRADQDTYENGKAIANVLKTVGGVTSVFGGKAERDAGHVGIVAGAGTDAAFGKGYTVEMKFKCQ
jgi:hypothetical protein